MVKCVLTVNFLKTRIKFTQDTYERTKSIYVNINGDRTNTDETHTCVLLTQ